MHITYDPVADAAYIQFTGTSLEPGRDTVAVEGPADAQGEVIIDWKNGKLIGIEVLGARAALREDILEQATSPGGGYRG